MRRESHVRFWEGGGVQFPSATRLVIGCQHEAEARQLLAELKDRLAQFGLSLHEGKTRLIEFGRFAPATSRCRAATPGDLRLPGLHALLRKDQERPVRGRARKAA